MRESLTARRFQFAARPYADQSFELNGLRGFISDAPAFQGVGPQCPRCRANIDQLECQFCGLRMQVKCGIVLAIPEDRAAHYPGCVQHCERTGTVTGKNILKQEYYLSLPYNDLSGRESTTWRTRANSYSYLVERVLSQNPGVDGGRILDLGAGNCWMSFRLALARYRPFAVDLHTCDYHGLGAGQNFRTQLPAMFPRCQAEFTNLPFQDGQFDAVVFNSSFHYVDDYKAAFREAFRCTRSGGMVIVKHTPGGMRKELRRKLQPRCGVPRVGKNETDSDSIWDADFFLEERLRTLEGHLPIEWTIHSPRFSFLWPLRPLAAKLFSRHEPHRFRIYTTRKP